MKASRAFLNEVEKKFNLMPFTLRFGKECIGQADIYFSFFF